jgi:urea transport system permease protein
MAMFLKLEASSVENTKIQSTPAFPISWTGIRSPRCRCSGSRFTVSPSPSRDHPGARHLRLDHRRGDVQAPGRRRLLRHHHPGGRAILTILIVGQQGYTGGINGMTDLRTSRAGTSGRSRQDRAVLLRGRLPVRLHLHRRSSSGTSSSAASWSRCATRRIGSASPAIASPTSRSSPSASPRCSPRSAARCSRSGRLHVAVLCRHRAVDRDGDLHRGRRPLSILGAVYGTLLVNFAKTSLSESFPELWLFGLGGCSSRSCSPSRTASPASGRDYVQPRIDR